MKALVAWSSGKDSAWALHVARETPGLEVAGLLTTCGAEDGKVAMHGTPMALVRAQAQSLGLPLLAVPIPNPCPNDAYDEAMTQALDFARSDGFEAVVFGDLFLQDIRSYRESRLADTGFTPVFPLWQLPTDDLAREMIAGGLKATIVAADAARVPRSFVGRELDEELLGELPDSVDPCGENGEFHTFVHDGPGFAYPVGVSIAGVRERDGLFVADLAPRP